MEIRVDGEPVDIDGVPAEQTARRLGRPSTPTRCPLDAVGHYLSGGALHTVTTGAPAPGPAGTGAYGLSSAAVSAEPRTGELVVPGRRAVGRRRARRCSPGPTTSDLGAGARTARTLSAPTVAATRSEAWVVRDGTDGGPGAGRRSAAGGERAHAAGARAGPTSCALSPDGVRAALVVDGAGRPRASTSGPSSAPRTAAWSCGTCAAVAPTLSQVVDVAWRDSGNLLVLAGDAAAGPDRSRTPSASTAGA